MGEPRKHLTQYNRAVRNLEIAHAAIIMLEGMNTLEASQAIKTLQRGQQKQLKVLDAAAAAIAAAAAEDAERLANAATVQVTPDPSFPTFDFDFGDMGAAMASLPPGTEYVRIVPVAAIDAARVTRSEDEG